MIIKCDNCDNDDFYCWLCHYVVVGVVVVGVAVVAVAAAGIFINGH